jgi:hypothetical protein
MKRLFTFVITMLLGASLAFAVPQATGGSTDTKTEGKKATKTKKGHKGGKKHKKGDKGGDTTAPPK